MRAGTSTVGLINFLASLSALITVVKTNQFLLVGLALAAFNGLLVAVNYIWNRGRLVAEAGAESATEAAKAPSRTAGFATVGPFRWGMQLVLLSATLGYMGLAWIENDAQALELSFNRSPALPGQYVFAQGEGFPPSTHGTLILPDGTQYRFRTDENGRFARSFEVPDLGGGSHRVTVSTDDGTSKTGTLEIGIPVTTAESVEPTQTVAVPSPTLQVVNETPVPTHTEGAPVVPTDTPTETPTPSPTVTHTPTHIYPGPSITPTFTPTPSPTLCDPDGCSPIPDQPPHEGPVADPRGDVAKEDDKQGPIVE